MKRFILTALFCGIVVSGSSAQYGQCKLDDKPDGFCTYGTGTTGGAGGVTVRISDYQTLLDSLESTNPLIIEIAGSIDLQGDNLTLRSNKTLIGVGENAILHNGGLETYKQTNVIIRNITFINAPDDLLKINQETTHFWVDHCTFYDNDDSASTDTDGLLDITRGSDFITISYCKFYNHDKCILIGHVDNEPLDAGKLRVTMHHNWFNKSIQRHPRVRQGSVHVYNNYYVSNSVYGVVSANGAKVLVESNYFVDVLIPTQLGVEGYSDSGDLKDINNIYVNCGVPQSTGIAFDPTTYYSYTADDASTVPTTVMTKAGAGSIKTVSVKQNRLSSQAQKALIAASKNGVDYDIAGKQYPGSSSTTPAKGVYFHVNKAAQSNRVNKEVIIK